LRQTSFVRRHRNPASLNLIVKSPVNSTKAYFLAALLAAPALQAQVTSAPIVQIRISSTQKTCFVADVGVRCSDVGATLLGMTVAANADIHIIGDRDVGYELLRTVTESLIQAGYKLKVGVMTQ
jgi:biopolymer transport protein ExbD